MVDGSLLTLVSVSRTERYRPLVEDVIDAIAVLDESPVFTRESLYRFIGIAIPVVALAITVMSVVTWSLTSHGWWWPLALGIFGLGLLAGSVFAQSNYDNVNLAESLLLGAGPALAGAATLAVPLPEGVSGLGAPQIAGAGVVVLRRLSDDHAFVGIPATAGEREALRAQLAQDGAALDAAQKSLTEARALLVQTEQQINDRAREFNARMDAANTAQAGWPAGTERDAIVAAQHDLTAKTTRYNTQAREFDARITAFNAATRRYNLMLVYPDGKDTENQIAERAGAKPVK